MSNDSIPDQTITWAAMLGMALWGGAVKYYRRVSKGLKHTWLRLVGELMTSALAGLGVGVICADSGWTLPWSLAFAGIAGHMGSALIDIGEDILVSVLRTIASAAGKKPE